MNRTVELVNLWAAFEKQYPNGTIEDFHRRSLAVIEEQENPVPPPGKLVPDLNGRFIILICRIAKFHFSYTNKAFEGSGLEQIEEFGLLATIYNQGSPIKSETIFNNIMELSSGANMLIRMKKRGLVTEFRDKADKRVIRLKVTPKGEEILYKAKEHVLKVARMILIDLNDEDKRLCMQLLAPVDRRFTDVFQKQRNKPFDEIFLENTANK
ncbi:MarR family winged helix-turn-helix transcriptional regulator [Mucilaginibacter aquariorum]|uniref:MarR family winged helix-turn-helix transcriptional regulator n=1 Tax=Mucilaginibacter aquariorum TaxID=2967225 RepID=A0ABT1SVL4_9SPHI|nr:MarR family winged helix-turn-helix transcriptional regulator [Mucilaginibacter aquariorum]MCQ6956379.1 MarR family winged helix-turn-helix transcriptional regulator [Mucilaginibacter aquariorum]